jgi:radical SAM protein with 4Fe4S-binding SPASM domain
MFDINFYMKSHSTLDYESIRNGEPIVYNIETTNACNMRCKMCPRTTMMTRPIQTISPELFKRIIDQLKPHRNETWLKWEMFAQEKYGIPSEGMSENHFFLYVIPKVIQLHGYGDPLLDKNMGKYVELLSERGFFSYFSCNPSNIDLKKTMEMFENGLSYIKYSIESTDDTKHKEVRGGASNFTESYNKILKVLEMKERRGFSTVVVITMLDLNQGKDDYRKLKKLFKDKDIYIYMKSEDQQWYRKDFHGTNSIHWSEPCRHPWMSMTIKSNGEAAMCMEDFNNEIVLGDTNKESLYDIWNGTSYERFRKEHMETTKGLKCVERCDMKVGYVG